MSEIAPLHVYQMHFLFLLMLQFSQYNLIKHTYMFMTSIPRSLFWFAENQNQRLITVRSGHFFFSLLSSLFFPSFVSFLLHFLSLMVLLVSLLSLSCFFRIYCIHFSNWAAVKFTIDRKLFLVIYPLSQFRPFASVSALFMVVRRRDSAFPLSHKTVTKKDVYSTVYTQRVPQNFLCENPFNLHLSFRSFPASVSLIALRNSFCTWEWSCQCELRRSTEVKEVKMF